MKGKKPENLTEIVGIPYLSSIINNNERASLDFVLETKEGPILCDYYTSVMSTHPICPIAALVNYAHKTSQEIKVEGRLVERIINDSTKATRMCCMNIYQIIIPNFGTYTPPELHIILRKEINGSQE